MCRKCGTDCRGEDSKRYLALAAMLVGLAPGAQKAIEAFAGTNVRVNAEMNEIEDKGLEISDEALERFNDEESAKLRAAYDTLPTPVLEEAAIQIKGSVEALMEYGQSLKLFIRERYQKGDRTASPGAQKAMQQAIDYEEAVRVGANNIADTILAAIGVQKPVPRAPDGTPMAPGSPQGVTS